MAAAEPKYVYLGGGNSAGYAAREYVKRGGPSGQLTIITDEPVRDLWWFTRLNSAIQL